MGHLQDHMHNYYSRMVAPGGVLDDQAAFYDEARVIFEWQNSFYNADTQTLTELGWMYALRETFTLASTAILSVGFLPHLTLPVGVFETNIDVDGVQDLTIQRFLGGTFSGGTPIAQIATNQDNPQDPPNQLAQEGVTIDTPGVLLFETTLIATGPGGSENIEGVGLVTPPNTVAYVTYTNNDNAAVDIEVAYLMAAMPGVPS